MKKKILLGLLIPTVLSIGFSRQVNAAESRAGITPRVIIDTDERKPVTGAQLEQAPYKQTVFLDISFEDGSIAYGSGAMISKDTVLTCGHVLFDTNKGWAKTVKVHAGYDGVNNKYYAESTEIVGKTAWTRGADMDYAPDIAAIKLDRPLGDQTGCFPIQKDSLIRDEMILTGFPGEKNKTMWTDKGVITKQYKYGIGYNADSSGGNSGSPVYNKKNELVAIHSGALVSPSLGTHNTGTTFTNDVKKAVDFWVTGQADVEVTGVSLSDQRVTLQKAETHQLSAIVTPTNASFKEGKWTSSNPSIATVDYKGMVKAKNNGQTTITFTSDDNKKQASCVVSIVDDSHIPVENIEFNYSDEIQYVEKNGIFSKYSPKFTPENASNKEVYYTSSNLEVLDLDLKDPYYPRYLKSGEVDVYCHSKDNGQAYKVATYHVDDHGDKLATATPITSGISEAGFFYRSYDLDYFKFVPTRSGEYTIDGEVIGKYSYELNQAWEFHVYDENNKRLYTTKNRKTSFNFDAGKVYYLRPALRRLMNLDEDIYRTEYVFDIYPKGTEKPNPITGISLNKTAIELDEGKKETLQATIKPANSPDDKSVRWTSSDESIATVNNGDVTGIKEGKATITAITSNGKTATCEVTVKKVTIPVERIELSRFSNDVSIQAGMQLTSYQKITAKVYPENATNQELEWSISDESIMKITQNGYVYALKEGTVKVTAKNGDVSGEIVLNSVPHVREVKIKRTLEPNEVYTEEIQMPGGERRLNEVILNSKSNNGGSWFPGDAWLSIIDSTIPQSPTYDGRMNGSTGCYHSTEFYYPNGVMTIKLMNKSATRPSEVDITLRIFSIEWLK